MQVEGTPARRSMLEFISSRIAKSGRTPNIEQVFAGATDYLYRSEDLISMFIEKWAEPYAVRGALPEAVQADFMTSVIPFKVLSTIDELSIAAVERTRLYRPGSHADRARSRRKQSIGLAC
jgi:hypothetical protein